MDFKEFTLQKDREIKECSEFIEFIKISYCGNNLEKLQDLLFKKLLH